MSYKHYNMFSVEPIVVETKSGGRMLFLDGYKFIRHRATGVKTRWYCSRHTKGCRAAFFTIDDTIVKLNNVHNHDLM